MTLILLIQPRELQINSRLTTRADSLSLISSFLGVVLLILAARNILNFLIPNNYSDEPKSLSGFFIHRIRHFFVDRSSEEGSPISHNTPVVLNSTELSGAMATETITISSVASPDPLIVTTDSDSNEPTFPKRVR